MSRQSDHETRWAEIWDEVYFSPLLFVTDVIGLPDKFQGCTACGAPIKGIGARAASTCDCPGIEPWQHYALIAVGESDRISIRSGHGVGKTTFFSWVTWWFLCTRSTCKVPIISNSSDQLRDTVWPELAKWQERLPTGLANRYEVQGEKVVLKASPKNCFAVARTAPTHKPEALQGFHAENLIELEDGRLVAVANLMVLIDEASGLDEKFFEVSRGALSGKGTKMIMAGNPTRTSGTFYDSHHKLRALYKCFHVSCLDVPRAQGHIDEIREQYGEESNAYRVRVLGEFPTQDDDTVIPLELVMGAVDRDIGSPGLYYPIWGLDVARYGDDRCALAKRLNKHLLEPIKHWGKCDLMVTVGKVKAEYDQTPPDLKPQEILVDVIGLGSGVVDRLKEQNVPVRGINVGESPSSKELYARLRDELWFEGREWFQSRNSTMPRDEELIAELTSPIYTFTSSGKIVVEPKKDMKKRGLRSPDLADAFLLTFACGLRKKVDHHRRAHTQKHSAWAR